MKYTFTCLFTKFDEMGRWLRYDGIVEQTSSRKQRLMYLFCGLSASNISRIWLLVKEDTENKRTKWIISININPKLTHQR